MNAAVDTWDINIRYVPQKQLYVGVMRTPQAIVVVTGATEQVCTDRLLERFGWETSNVKWGSK